MLHHGFGSKPNFVKRLGHGGHRGLPGKVVFPKTITLAFGIRELGYDEQTMRQIRQLTLLVLLTTSIAGISGFLWLLTDCVEDGIPDPFLLALAGPIARSQPLCWTIYALVCLAISLCIVMITSPHAGRHHLRR